MQVKSSRVALMVVDSRLDQNAVVDKVIVPALRHWGVPYEQHDLAKPPTRKPDASRIAVILFAQEGIPTERLRCEIPVLEEAVSAGAGIVNCDPGLAIEVGDGGQSLKLAQRPWSTVAPVLSARIAQAPHYVTRMQRSIRSFRFRKPVPCLPAGEGESGDVLLADDAGTALLDVKSQPARIASWRLSSWVWSDDFHGFARGMDALLWRSLLWAARKPFAIAAFPPYGRFRLDDCRGIWRSPEDLRFLDVMRAFGEVPNLCICLSALTDAGWKMLADRASRGEVEVSPHVLEPEVGIFNVDESDGGRPESDPLAARITHLFRSHGCRMAKSVSDHNHEITTRGIRIARELGLVGRMNVMRAGERWETLHKRWRPAPFGNMHYALDWYADAPDIFVAINHHAAFSDSFVDLGEASFLCTPFGGFTPDRWDFLNGNVRSATDKDLDRALQRLLVHAELALTSLFFAGSITHTHFACLLSNEDWAQLLSGYRSYVDEFGYRPLPYDGIVAHAIARVSRAIVDIDPSRPASVPMLVARDGPQGPAEAWHGIVESAR